MVDTINGDDTNQDPGGIETPTVEEAENDYVTQELQNSVAMNQIPTVDQLNHVNQLSGTIWQQPANNTNITAFTTQPLYIGKDCHPSPKSWSVVSRMATSSI